MDDAAFPLRININLQLQADVESYARAVNRQLVAFGHDAIAFDGPHRHLPHVTLLMGVVADAAACRAVLARCEAFARQMAPVAFGLSEPYWNRPAEKLLFIDLTPADVLLACRRQLRDALGDLFVCDFHGRPDTRAHITVAFADMQGGKPSLSIEDAMPASSHSGAIRVCTVGAHGTCTTVLARFL